MNEKKTKNIVQGIFEAEAQSAASIREEQLGKYSEIAVNMFHTPVLTMREKLFPAFGEFAAKVTKGLEVYRTMYFVNVLHIDMAYVAAILALIGIYDVLNDPLMGIAYDKTRTRWGKARPYVVFGAIPYFVSTVILYSGAMVLGGSATNDPKKILFVFVMLFLQETFSTIYSLPRGNMLTLMSPNPEDRINVGLLSTYIGEPGASLVYVIIPPLMELNNKGYIHLPMSQVFMITAIIAGVVGSAGNIVMAVGCRERILLQPKPAPLNKTMFYILKNKYALRNFAASFATSWWSNGGYSWDVVTQQEIFGGSIPSFVAYLPYNILNTLSVTFIPKFKKLFKNNNRNAVIALRFWDILTFIGMTAVGVPNIGKDRKWVMVGIYAFFFGLDGLNNGPANVFEAELGREINDYTEYVTGERPDGTFGILANLIMKITQPLNTLLTIKLFRWSGYDTSIKMKPWSQGDKVVYQKIFFLWQGITVLPNVARVIPYFFYDLVGEKREQMYIALNERRALVASDSNSEVDALAEAIRTETQAES